MPRTWASGVSQSEELAREENDLIKTRNEEAARRGASNEKPGKTSPEPSMSASPASGSSESEQLAKTTFPPSNLTAADVTGSVPPTGSLSSEAPGPPLQLLPPASPPSDVGSLPGVGHQPSPDALRMLDLLDRQDAETVQERLKALGYFDGIPDGVWGPSSRSALKTFRRTQGLGGNDLWDSATQLALMSAQAAAAASRPLLPGVSGETKFSPRFGALRNPLNRNDAVWIQSRLRYLGLYSGEGDGVWGAASRTALQEFKQQNGLPPNEIWDGATERKLSAAPLPSQEVRHGR
jgi:hypothetical protein